MNENLISNPVYQNIQIPSVDEPVAKSTILYANRYAGINEVKATDEELLAVLSSTIGLSGNNVLIQLKNKMTTFRNGPWYIDSKNGVIYIHNRKYTKDNVYKYTYQYENGEVLSVSFRMVESSPISGLGGFVKAVSKAIHTLEYKVVNPPNVGLDRDSYDYSPNEPNPYPYSPLQINLTEDDIKPIAIDTEYKKYNSTSKEERKSNYDQKYIPRYDNISEDDMWGLLTSENNKHRNTQLKIAWDIYIDRLKNTGKNSQATNQAASELLRESKKAGLLVPASDPDWGKYNKTLSFNIICADTSMANESTVTSLAHKRVYKYFEDNHILYKDLTISILDIKRVGITGSYDSITGRSYQVKYLVKCKVDYFGYNVGKRLMTGERFIRGLMDRYENIGSLSNMVNNAADNIGKGKLEKKLQASMRVIGNPILETGQQLEIQNVGKKHSGIWYIHKITHEIEFGQGYIVNMQLSRQRIKPGYAASMNEIHTQSYTVDNEETDVNSVKRSGMSSTSTSSQSKANVASGNNEYTYQDALNVPFTIVEEAYARTLNEEELVKFIYRKADREYHYGKNGATPATPMVTAKTHTDGVTYTETSKSYYTKDRTRGYSNNYERVMNYKNRNR